MRYSLVACVVIACGPPKPATTVPAPPVTVADVAGPAVADGLVPPQPTLRLPRNFLPTGYDLQLDIDPAKPSFHGVAKIAGTVGERSSVIWLHGFHLEVARAVARSGSTEVALAVTPKGDDLLEVRAQTPLDGGPWTLELAYTGELDGVNTTGAFRQTVGGRPYVFTQLEAIYARRVFPSFDEPNVKVPFAVALRVPAALTVVGNTPIAKETAEGATKLVELAVTKPLPTYLLAFGVGPFEIVDAGKSKRGTPVRIVTLAGRSADAQYAAQTSARVLDGVEDYFGTPYPYEKLDMLTIPITVGFGAMENAGLITYSETIMLMDPKHPSQSHMEDWLGVAAHEIAHQWFGNLVTPEFWDDIWLNEGFATWLTSKITATLEPAWRTREGLLERRNRALGADSLISARRVRQPIEAVGDIETAFDGITYVKGASVLSMFESYVGEDVFQRGIRDYLAARAWGNATSADFVAAIAKASGKPVEAAFASFLDQPGAPELAVTSSCRGGKVEVTLAQRRYVPAGAPEPAAGTPWILPVCLAYDKAGKRAEQCTLVDQPTATIQLASKTCPRWVMPNVEGRGYYRTAYTVAQVAALRDEAWPKLSWSERRAVHFDVRAAATNGRLPLQLALSFTPRLMAAGTDRYAIDAALALPSGLYELVPDELRGKYEHWMRRQFGAAATAVGLTAKDTDTLDVEVVRSQLVDAVAWRAREPALVAEAVKLAERWRELPEAIRGDVLGIAVDAKPELFDRTLREVATEPDRAKRAEMFGALASVRDPARYKAALALILDAKIDIREAMKMVFYAHSDATKDIAKDYVRANREAIMARFPNAAVAGPIARFAYVFTATCKAEQRDAIADYVTKAFGAAVGGERVVKQAIESMDQCIARRKLLDAEVRAWLGGLRLPRT